MTPHIVQPIEGLATQGAVELFLVNGVYTRDVTSEVSGAGKFGATDCTDNLSFQLQPAP